MRPTELMRFAAVCFVFGLADNVAGDGILVPPLEPDAPHFTIKYHHVAVQIEDRLATTRIDQVFVNETNREQEATYIFPLPPGAVVKDFSLLVDGTKLAGEMLPREQAVALYEEIVRKRRDPALLEYTGRDTYKARISPLPPRGERRIEIEYTEVLPFDSGLVSYNYPLSTEKFSKQLVGETVFEAKIRVSGKLGAIYSPSHEVDVARNGTNRAIVSYEEKNTRPDRDLLLYFAVTEQEVGASVVTFKERGKDGFFMLIAAPGQEDEGERRSVPKNIVFVLDRSGSMAGEKIEQARKALRFCIDNLNPDDQFGIVTFASGVRTFSEALVPASADHVRKARDFVDEIRATGGTDIDGALQEALRLRKPGAPNYIAFITDGRPTVGEVRDPDEIVRLTRKRIAEMENTPTRLFTFGVGFDVDTHFLDRLADENGGVPVYVRPNEDIEVKVSGWYAKIAWPVLTDVDVDYGNVRVYDTYPQELPDLFAGSQVIVFGRYRDGTSGETTVTLSGDTGQGKRVYTSQVTFPDQSPGAEYLAPLWASRKIGYLLHQIRLHGREKELVDEVIALSVEYGILTEYTAFLADGDNVVPLAAAPGMAARGMQEAFASPTGAWAASQSDNAQALRSATTVSVGNRYRDAQGRQVQIANVQIRGQHGYVHRGGQWQDLRYDPTSQPVDLQVQAYSEAYFQLSRAFPGLNQALALSDNMVVIINGRAVQIGSHGRTVLTDEELRLLGAAGA